MKTAELEGVDLDRWVALAQGYRIAEHRNGALEVVSQDGRARFGYLSGGHPRYSPSTDAAQGLDIIRRHNIGVLPPTRSVHRNGGPNAGWGVSGTWAATTWHAGHDGRRAHAWHESDPLIAAMRAFVASVYGDEVQG